MSYGYSAVDKKNIEWLANDNTRATLSRICLVKGSLRGLHRFDLELEYPLTAIAGKNGCGKSTLLALAACAYHNHSTGYKLKDRKIPYYRFSDFFVQSRNETPPEGIKIRYKFLHKWRGGKVGPGWQTREKPVGGKWNNYGSRVRRNVVYFGIQRVVPHYERSTHKSYRGLFQGGTLRPEHQEQIRNIAGRIFEKTYDVFNVYTHLKYSLPVASSAGIRYSGFNMGAGESAVFAILSALFESGKSTLLIIDEIELGLHESAQIRFIKELKDLCVELHCQIVCSTHSHIVLSALPPEGRVFLETRGSRTVVTPGISPDLACGNLRGENTPELDIFVEDSVAKMILEYGLPHDLRSRVSVMKIGSSEAVVRHLSSRYLERKDACLCILDGDKRKDHTKALSHIKRYLESQFRKSENEMKEWSDKRLMYLPSEDSPEKWLIEGCRQIKDKSALCKDWCVNDVQIVEDALACAERAEVHSKFYELGRKMNLDTERARGDVIRFLTQSKPNLLEKIVKHIKGLLRDDI